MGMIPDRVAFARLAIDSSNYCCLPQHGSDFDWHVLVIRRHRSVKAIYCGLPVANGVLNVANKFPSQLSSSTTLNRGDTSHPYFGNRQIISLYVGTAMLPRLSRMAASTILPEGISNDKGSRKRMECSTSIASQDYDI
jgi:hypothetical protein